MGPSNDTRAARGLTPEQQAEATIIQDRIKDIIGHRAIDMQVSRDLASGRMAIESIQVIGKEVSSGTIYQAESGDEILMRCRLTMGAA